MREAYQQALDIRERLAKQTPKDVENERLLANSYMNIGLVEKDSGHLDKAAQHFQQAQKIRADLLKDDPGAVDVQRDIAMAAFYEGRLDVKAGNLAVAGNEFRESIRLFAVLAKAPPSFQSGNSMVCWATSGQRSRPPRMRSLATRNQLKPGALVERNPEVVEYASVLAVAYMELGKVQMPPASLTSFEHARDLLQRWAGKYSGNPQLQRDLGVTYYEWGKI